MPQVVERQSRDRICLVCATLISQLATTNHVRDIGTVLWSISKPTLDPSIIRRNLAAARERAFFPLWLPTGMTMQDMEKHWNEFQFNPAAPVDVPFKPELFRPAPRSVQVLRRLSRKGQSDLDFAAREQGGREKLVLGLPNDAREMAPLLAHAHGNLGGGPLSAPSVGEGSTCPVGTTASSDLLTEPQHFEGAREPVASPVIAGATDQEQERAAVPLMMTSRVEGPTTVDVGEQIGQLSETVPPPGTKAGSGDFVSKSAVAHLEEMLSEDQRRIAGDFSGGPVHPRPAHHDISHSGAAEHISKSSQLIKNLNRSLRDVDEID
jgi:hypothetical protein